MLYSEIRPAPKKQERRGEGFGEIFDEEVAKLEEKNSTGGDSVSGGHCIGSPDGCGDTTTGTG